MSSTKVLNTLLGNVKEHSTTDSHRERYHHHYSVLFVGGKRLATGSNHLRNSYNGRCVCYSTHAEMDVIYRSLRCFPGRRLTGGTIGVIRWGRDGTLRNSRPCNHCLDTMCSYGIKKIMYSTDDGVMVTERPDLMSKSHISSGWSMFTDPARICG